MADPRIDQARHERNAEKAKRLKAEFERDQLLEGIEAHRSSLNTRPRGERNVDLYALADRIKSKGGDAHVRETDPQGGDGTTGLQATRGGSDQVDGVAPEQTSCPTCGQPVEVHHDSEGTSYYLPVVEDQKLRELWEWAEATANSYSVAPPGEINEWSERIYRDLAARIQSSLSSEAGS